MTRLLAGAVEASGCDHLGLQLGQAATPLLLGLAGLLVCTAPTVGTALDTLARHLDLHDEGGTPVIAGAPA